MSGLSNVEMSGSGYGLPDMPTDPVQMGAMTHTCCQRATQRGTCLALRFGVRLRPTCADAAAATEKPPDQNVKDCNAHGGTYLKLTGPVVAGGPNVTVYKCELNVSYAWNHSP